MRETIRSSAPANLLLMGEYAVLEEGGLGIAVAPEVRARALRETRDDPGDDRVTGRLPDGEVSWPGAGGFLGRLCEHLRATLGDGIGRVSIDTDGFYYPDGRKRGFGSSAAVAVVLSALWADALGAGEGALLQLSVEAHRVAQGGHGSGYDVAVSLFGGIGLFTGGGRPTFEPLALPWMPSLAVFSGARAVPTPGAVARYREWKRTHPAEARRFLLDSNQAVLRFARAGSIDEALERVELSRELGIQLGTWIGADARMEAPPALVGEDAVCKAVGAGNELGVAFLRDGERLADPPGASGFELVRIAAEGLRWE